MGAGSADRFALPAGTVTLLLADVQAATGRKPDERDARDALRRWERLVDEAVGLHDGIRSTEETDAVVAAFSRPSDAVACALDVHRAVARSADPNQCQFGLRVALHTGEIQLRDDGNYIGSTIDRCARLREVGYPGQTLVSRATHDLVVDRLPPGCALKDMGVHRLRDLGRPEQVYQLCHVELREAFPPLRSLDSVPNNLPLAPTSFIGRRGEIAEIRKLLTEARLLSLTGPGGCGKTRLALHVAAEVLDDYPDGVWFVDLGPIADPGLVPNAVVAALSLVEAPGRTPSDVVVRNLGSKRALLIMDNCEHVLPDCAPLVEEITQRCPAMTILTTTRELLDLPAEISYRVPSLPVPAERSPEPLEAVTQYDGVKLFIERAIKARRNFKITNDNAPAVAQICHRLDGIPLAIELAAVRTRVLTPQQLLDGLEDRFRLLAGGPRTSMPRQQTLQASVDWSHDLLEEPARVLLRRLSVFAGGFTLDAAEEICAGDGIEAMQILDLLTDLVDKSLVLMNEEGAEARYRLLETVRQYGLARLVDAGEERRTRARHRDFFLRLAEADLNVSFAPWFGRVASEYDNLRVALAWSRNEGDAEALNRLAGALVTFWVHGARFGEGRAWLEAATARVIGDAAARAKALYGYAWLCATMFDYLPVPAAANEALSLYRDLDDKAGVAHCLAMLGWLTIMVQTPDDARPLLEESLETADAAGDPSAQALARVSLGYSEIWREPASSRRIFEEAIAYWRRANDSVDLYPARVFLGYACYFGGDLRAAERTLSGVVEDLRTTPQRLWVGFALSLLGACLVALGRADEARMTLDEALEVARENGLGFLECNSLFYRGILEIHEGNPAAARDSIGEALAYPMAMQLIRASCLTELARAEFLDGAATDAEMHATEAIALARQLDARWTLARALLVLGFVRGARGAVEEAENLCHEALALQVALGESRQIIDSLESLGGLAAAQESYAEAVRLFAAAETHRAEIGYGGWHYDRRSQAADVARCRERLGPDGFDRAWAEGAALSLDEALAYAARGRGERKRPSTGWASLTPAELNVVRLVAEGLTNPQVGEKLFISRKTVQAHLARIFTKLGVSTRAALAAEATRRGI